MVGKREATRELLRRKLLQAATRRIEAAGLDALRARDVTDDAGCGLGTLYTCYQDLDHLVLFVNSGTLARLGERLAQASAGIEAPRERLTAFALSYLGFARENRNLWFALFDHRLPAGVPVPDWHLEEHGDLIRLIVGPLAQLRPDLDADELMNRSRTLFAAVHGVIALSLQGRFIGVPDTALEGELHALTAMLTRPADEGV